MSIVFSTGLRNAGQRFAASKGIVYVADEDGLIEVEDPDHQQEFAAIYRVFDPANPTPGDEVTVTKQARVTAREAAALTRLDVPDQAPVATQTEAPPVEPAAAPASPDPAASTDATAEQTPAPSTDKPWLQRVLG